MNYPRKNLIYLKWIHTFQSNQIKYKNPKYSLPFKRFIVPFLTTLNPKKTKSQIKAHLSYLANSYFHNYKPSPRILRQYCVLRNLRKNKDIVITKPDKGDGVVILDQKLYDSTIEEAISDNSKFEKLNEDPTLKREAPPQRFLRKSKQKIFFNKNEYDKLYLRVLLLLVSMVLLKCTNSPLVIHFLNFVRLFRL